MKDGCIWEACNKSTKAQTEIYMDVERKSLKYYHNGVPRFIPPVEFAELIMCFYLALCCNTGQYVGGLNIG